MFHRALSGDPWLLRRFCIFVIVLQESDRIHMVLGLLWFLKEFNVLDRQGDAILFLTTTSGRLHLIKLVEVDDEANLRHVADILAHIIDA